MNQFRIAYFVNQYPKVSHTFIRREIHALERQGFAIQRIALRGWNADLVDAEDVKERERTCFVLKSGAVGLLLAVVRILVTRPFRFFLALQLALKMGIRADRPLFFHLIYLAEACRIIPWLKAFGAQHVHAHFGTNSAEIVMLAHTMGGPSFSFTVHGPEEFDKPEFLAIREKVKHSAFVRAISSFGRSQLYRWIDYVDWPKVHVVHCGLDQLFFDVPAVSIPVAPRVVCVGRLCEQKGQMLLVDAVHSLAQEGIELEVILAGDGEMRAELEKLIVERKLHGKVRITGWISSDQVRKEILSARALLLPSFAEGLPVVIMEAMALRRPVLTTHIAGIPELVRAGEDGWIFPPGDVEALVSALKEFLATPAEVLKKMGDSAHQRVLERHSVDIEAEKLAKLFRLVINEPTVA
ncbi:MAG TPA: glycosyltransferase family 4 protein [Gallionellaceae bacterium]|nr:glycosyltransferase family 4 protein [Gallionellaceae bacterium]